MFTMSNIAALVVGAMILGHVVYFHTSEKFRQSIGVVEEMPWTKLAETIMVAVNVIVTMVIVKYTWVVSLPLYILIEIAWWTIWIPYKRREVAQAKATAERRNEIMEAAILRKRRGEYPWQHNVN